MLLPGGKRTAVNSGQTVARLTAPPSNEVRVLLAKTHRLFAEAMQQLLESEGINVVGTCVTGQEALAAVDALRPTMVVIGFALPDVCGIELGRQIVLRSPSTKVLVIAPGNNAKTARKALDSGLHGCITRQSSVQQLISSIAAVSEGNVVMPPQTVGRDAESHSVRRNDGEALLASHLTPRERQVLTLLLRGASSKEIAKRLALRPNTVRTHVQNVLTKLQVHSRLEAAAVASRLGLFEELEELEELAAV